MSPFEQILVIINTIGLIVLAYFKLQETSEARLAKKEATADDIALAPIKQSEKQSELASDAIGLTRDTLNGLRDVTTKIGDLVDQVKASNVLEGQRLSDQRNREAGFIESFRQLRDDVAANKKAIADHNEATAPAIKVIMDQKPTVDETHKLVVGLPEMVGQKMRSDFEELHKLVEAFKEDVDKRLDAIAAQVKAIADKAPVSVPPQPATLPEITTEMNITGMGVPSGDPVSSAVIAPLPDALKGSTPGGVQ